MKRLLFTIISLFTLMLVSCREKETGPDYAKPLVGNWKVDRADIVRYIPDSSFVFTYNPADSGHVAQLTVKKIDPITINIYMRLSRGNGLLLYEYSFDTPLVQDPNNEEIILFNINQHYGSGGYNAEENLLMVYSIRQANGEWSGSSFRFWGRR